MFMFVFTYVCMHVSLYVDKGGDVRYIDAGIVCIDENRASWS